MDKTDILKKVCFFYCIIFCWSNL